MKTSELLRFLKDINPDSEVVVMRGEAGHEHALTDVWFEFPPGLPDFERQGDHGEVAAAQVLRIALVYDVVGQDAMGGSPSAPPHEPEIGRDPLTAAPDIDPSRMPPNVGTHLDPTGPPISEQGYAYTPEEAPFPTAASGVQGGKEALQQGEETFARNHDAHERLVGEKGPQDPAELPF